MTRLLVAAIAAVAVLAPAGAVSADPDDISKPAAVLRSADRTGHRVSTSPPPAPAPRSSSTPAPQGPSELSQVLDLVNAERTSRGLVPLRFSSDLNEAALGHTRRQADDGAIFHTDPSDGSNPGHRISRTGYVSSTWGENVAAGYRSAADVMDGWMDSPGHCRNILNPAFTEIGVGHVTGGARFGQFWTQKFARPSGEPRPAGEYDSAWC